MILYFTGTGNSRYAARQLGKVLEDEVYPIQGDLKANREGVFDSQRPYVFVSPTYAWRLPRVVEEYIIQSRFEGSRMAYFILTCGDSVGAAAEYAAGPLFDGKNYIFYMFMENTHRQQVRINNSGLIL